MDVSTLLASLQTRLGSTLPMVLGAIGILVLGWVIALLVRAGVRSAGNALRLNRRINKLTHQDLNVEGWIASAVFWLVMIITLAAVFNSLNLEAASAPFAAVAAQVLGYLPHLLAGAALAVLAWVLATAARAILLKVLSHSLLDTRLHAAAEMKPMSGHIATAAFWLVILMFVPMILSALDMRGLLGPVENMINQVLMMLPQVFAALLIGGIGYFVAKVLRGLVTALVAATGVDRVGGGKLKLSGLAGTLVFIFVFVPALISAFDALKIEVISKPATDMLSRFMNAIPDIFAAALILAVTYAVARLVADFLGNLLRSLNFDALPAHFGFARGLDGAFAPSAVVARMVVFFAMLFATVEAANRLGFTQVRDVVTTFITFGGQIVLGGVILLIGFWIANIASRAIRAASGEENAVGATVAKVAILALVIAMALRAMGLANDIVNLAFGLSLGAVAGAVLLAFGLGGREAAGRQMEYWLSKWRK